MKTIFFLKGLPASGKSTWAKEYLVKNYNTTIRINKDDLRTMLHDNHWSKVNEQTVVNIRDAIIIESMQSGINIIIDDTNFCFEHYKRVKSLVDANNDNYVQDSRDFEYELLIKEFDVSVEECILRDSKRAKPVGSEVILSMAKKYLTNKENHAIMYVQNKELPRAIICDLDGTLCLHNGRSPFDYLKCDTDLVNEPIAKIIKQCMYYSDIMPIFVSGREDYCKLKTERWLRERLNLVPHQYKLFMRETGDYRKDSLVKKEIFDKEIKDKYYVDFVLDDRNQVVSMWRELGLVCLQVAPGNF